MDPDANRFRMKRFALFLETLDKAGVKDRPVRILDIGGTSAYWEGLRPLWAGRTFDITVLNVGVNPTRDGPYWIVPGDACDLSEFKDNSFDIVHSNSVIEHVGVWARMVAMASEVRRLAPHHFVQTPNFWFPIEPHFRTALIHWYPEPIRAQMLVRKQRGFHTVEDYDDAMLRVQGIRLVTRREMAHLFPDSDIRLERVGPIVKSLMAVR